MTWWRRLTTHDRVVTLFAFTIAALLIIDVLAIVVLSIWRPEVDVSLFVTISSDIVAMMLGALLGYVGGRQTAT